MAKNKSWVITISGDRSIKEISKDLERAGLVLSATLTEVGCIVGLASEKNVTKLRQVQGVTDVSPDGALDVGPPDSHTTW